MKPFLLLLLICALTTAKAQIKLASGQYTTEDGYYTVTINFLGDDLTLIEPNKTSVYKRLEGNIFKFINPTNNIDYRIEVMSENLIHAYKPTGGNRTIIKKSSNDATATNEQFNTYFAIAEKYKAKMKTDANDAQLWSFCAAAAMARSSMNDDGFKEYAAKVTSAIKAIIVNKAKCPCEDAIPTNIWQTTP